MTVQNKNFHAFERPLPGRFRSKDVRKIMKFSRKNIRLDDAERRRTEARKPNKRQYLFEATRISGARYHRVAT